MNSVSIIKSIAILAFVGASLSASVAAAQTDMSCSDMLKANAQLDAATKDAMAKDAAAADLDKKMNDYCTKNPKAKVSEAMEKVMMQ